MKAISYILIAAFIIVLTILLLIYLRRKNTIQYTKELEAKNEQIQIQNTAILEQTQHLEEINKAKDRLFSIVSHDLKDSISSIKGFLDLLKEDSISKEEFNELIPELSENANNASLLLYNLLNWSKSQMQNLEPNPELVNIQEVFSNKLALVEPKIEQKRIVLIDESQRDFVYADKSMVEIVIQNLITNAVKFSKVGDIITISNRDQNGKSLICVEDTGVGMSKENLNKLFKGNNYTTVGTKNEKGTGLGLTICKELVELNKGRIWVESTENVGSKFYVELPKAKPINQ
jgi:signal transduction histidine kinase